MVLLTYMAIGLLGGPPWLIGIVFVSGPVLLLLMVWQVLQDKSLSMHDLEQDEDWGYQDLPDLRPNDKALHF